MQRPCGSPRGRFSFGASLPAGILQIVHNWHIDLTDGFGVESYPFGTDATLTLRCKKRTSIADEPQVEITSDRPITVEICRDEGRRHKTVNAG